MNIKIIVATHKAYNMPHDSIYLPLHVGKLGKADIGFLGDDTGDNISNKNPYFCELTGLYWAWKNLDADCIGLCHYRRHFAYVKKIPKAESEKFKVLLNGEQAQRLLESNDIVLPKKRKYYIENLYDHYKHTLFIEQLDTAGEIIGEKCPEFLPEFEKLKKRTSAHMFNMLIMKKEILSDYCSWLFDILFELEKRVSPEKFDTFHARYLGRVSELLLDVWLNTKGYKYTEIPVVDMQGVNWLKKGTAFLLAKFTGKKYGKSF